MASGLVLWSERVVEHWSGVTSDSVSPLLPCHTNQLARFELFVRVTRRLASIDELKKITYHNRTEHNITYTI